MLPPEAPSAGRSPRQNARFVVPAALPVEIYRPELHRLLTSNGQARVVLLVAPSGYGKTTVLAQWARAQTTPVIWLRLNEDDRDPRTLYTDLAQASAAAGIKMEQWDRVSLMALSREQLGAALAMDLNAHDAHVTLIFDSGEHLGGDSARVLSNLMLELGEGQRLLIAQHEASPFSAAPFLARGEGLILAAPELTFSPDEIRAATTYMGAPQAVPAAVYEQDRGWPAGVMLALHTHQSSRPVPVTVLVQHLLYRLPHEISRWLPSLAVLTIWSAEEARRLGVPLPPGWLDTVLRAGLPLTPLGEGKFVPHDVVRELLIELLKQDPDTWQRLHLHIGEQAESSGQPYSAIRHYVQAGREDLAVRLAEELMPRWYRAADWLLVREALEPLPSSRLSAPLRSLLALALLETGQTERGRELAQDQVRLAPTPTAHLTLSLAAYRAGQMPTMIEHIEAGLNLATEQRDLIQLLRFKAIYLQSTRHLDEALAAANEAVSRAEAIGEVSLTIASLSVKAFILEMRSERPQALRENKRAYLAGQQLGLTNRLMPIVDRLALLYLAEDRADDAAGLLEDYLSTCERHYPLAIPAIHRRLAQVRHAQGRREEGLATAQHAFEALLKQENPSLASDALEYFYYTLLLRGQRAEAVTAFDRIRLLLGEDQPRVTPITWISNRRMHGYLAYVDGQLPEALAYLEQASAEESAVFQVHHLLTELLRAEILRQQGQLQRTHADVLVQALRESPEEEVGFRMVYPHFEPLLQTLIRQDWHTEAFRAVLARGQGNAYPSPPRLQLYLTTLGRVHVTLNGREVRLGHGPAVEALVYRVLHPEVRQDVLADQVWGGADLRRARQSAHTARTTLNTSFRAALRDAGLPLAHDLILPGQGRRNPEWVINAAVQVTCDAQAILHTYTPQGALWLYGGLFLPDSISEWVQTQRELIHQHVARVLQEGAARIETQEPGTALAWLVKAADLVQTPEAFERVIVLSRQMGDVALTSAAEQAIHALALGEVAVLSRPHALN